MATRKASQACVTAVADGGHLFGGSADLTGNTGTKVDGVAGGPDSPEGRQMYFGVREHAMGSAMVGAACHGGMVPIGGTFLVFADYMRPPVRLAAMSGAKCIFVWTHDSLGVGEDGPTHQPVEQLMSLRAIPDLRVIRPADGPETAGAWQFALDAEGPSAIVLSRQDLPVLDDSDPHRVAEGAYPVVEAADPDVILIGTGSEVSVCVEAAARLAQTGIWVQGRFHAVLGGLRGQEPRGAAGGHRPRRAPDLGRSRRDPGLAPLGRPDDRHRPVRGLRSRLGRARRTWHQRRGGRGSRPPAARRLTSPASHRPDQTRTTAGQGGTEMGRLHDLHQLQGQSPWLDNLRRGWMTSGELQAWIDRGVRGLTSNPSIFAKAMTDTDDYDAELETLARGGATIEDAYWQLVVGDIRRALELLRPVHDASGGEDGYVSVEVAPTWPTTPSAPSPPPASSTTASTPPTSTSRSRPRPRGSRPSKPSSVRAARST